MAKAKKAKTTKGAAVGKHTTSVAALSADGTLPLISVPDGSTLRVVVDVGPMTIQYAVAYAGRTVIKSLVDRSELVAPLLPGQQLLTWSFSHTEKGWQHAIGFAIDNGKVQLLERKSEANKDADHSMGAAVVQIEE